MGPCSAASSSRHGESEVIANPVLSFNIRGFTYHLLKTDFRGKIADSVFPAGVILNTCMYLRSAYQRIVFPSDGKWDSKLVSALLETASNIQNGSKVLLISNSLSDYVTFLVVAELFRTRIYMSSLEIDDRRKVKAFITQMETLIGDRPTEEQVLGLNSDSLWQALFPFRRK